MVTAVRGAIKIRENTKRAITEATLELVENIVEVNHIKENEIISIIFTQTRDITAINPATALRTRGFKEIPLLCTQEPYYHGSVEGMLRILITYRGRKDKKPIPVYLKGAEKLRSDLF
ncbi:MAG: chorismate mutase [Spirochaetes bacterium]|nr:MAG: chorismate mutase [Spirochaetota bacterium]